MVGFQDWAVFLILIRGLSEGLSGAQWLQPLGVEGAYGASSANGSLWFCQRLTDEDNTKEEESRTQRKTDT
jgi:hypothetical protein